MFPIENIDLILERSTELNPYDGKVFMFDFDKNEFVVKDGKLVEISKTIAIKQFVSWTLRTQIDKYKIYSDYGIDKEILIGQKSLPTSFVNSEFKRIIEEQLTRNPSITRIENFSFSKERTTLTVLFDIVTTDGVINISEVI